MTPVIIDNNSLIVTSTDNYAWGVYLEAVGSVFADITNNDLSGGIIGDEFTTGIFVWSDSSIGRNGSVIAPMLIDNNILTVTSIAYPAGGVYLFAQDDLFTEITNNDMTGGITGVDTYGAYLMSLTSIIGNASFPALFQNNSGTIDGANERYILYLATGVVGGGNNVDWTSNTFTPAGGDGTWDGNYDAGETLPQSLTDENQPIYTNLGVGDTLSP